MKKTKLLLGLLSICLLSSCQSNTLNVIQIESVAFADESIKMYIGEEKEINYNILPENATNKAVQFIITNNNVIKFENNKIIALASGESRLIIRSLNNKEDSLLIKVKSKLDEINPFIEKIKESYSNELNNSIGGYASILENNKGKNITFTTYQDGIKIDDSGVSTLYYKEDNKVYTYNNKKEIFGEIGTDFTEEKSKEIISLFHYNDVYGIGNILLDTIDNYINNEFINLVTMKIENTEEDNQILEKYTLNLEYTKDKIYYENMVRTIFTEGNLKSGGFSLYQYEKNKQGKTLSMNIFTASIDYGDRIEFDKSQLN